MKTREEILKEYAKLPNVRKRKITVKEALSKIYNIRGTVDKNNNRIQSRINVPVCLMGKKVKLKLVEENLK